MNSDKHKPLLKKFLEDAQFRHKVLKNPKATLEAEGFEASDDLVEKFKNADHKAVEKAVTQHGSGNSAGC